MRLLEVGSIKHDSFFNGIILNALHNYYVKYYPGEKLHFVYDDVEVVVLPHCCIIIFFYWGETKDCLHIYHEVLEVAFYTVGNDEESLKQFNELVYS